ncbi:MAG: HEAT repeat domain-containing protein [Planctomycetes bacterium]|nr:HEAT repeat domain-containing protein [Planctomycetota bacterium]
MKVFHTAVKFLFITALLAVFGEYGVIPAEDKKQESKQEDKYVTLTRDIILKELDKKDVGADRILSLKDIEDEAVIENLKIFIKPWQDEGRQLAVVSTLKEIGTDKAIQVLEQITRTNTKSVRLAAVKALADIAPPQTAESFKKLLRDPDMDVRYQAAVMMASLNDETAKSVLKEYLERQTRLHNIPWLLVELGDTSIIQYLKDTLDRFSEQQDNSRSFDAAVALSMFGDNYGLAFMKRELENENKFRRLAVLRAYAKFAMNPDTKPLMAALVKEKDPEVLNAIFGTLAAIGDPATIDPIKAFAQKYPHSHSSACKDCSIAALCRVCNKSVSTIPVLEELAGNENKFIRMDALKALSTVGSEQAYLIMEKAIGDSDPDVRHLAVQLVFADGNRKYARMLKHLLNDSDKMVRYYAASAFARMNEPSGVSVLEKLLEDDELRYGAAVDMLRFLANPSPADAVNVQKAGLENYNSGCNRYAVTFFKRAIRYKPDYAEAYYSLGLSSYKANRLGESIAYFNTALRLKPDYLLAHRSLANIYWKLQMWYLVLSEYEKITQSSPDDWQSRFYYGQVLNEIGKYGQAIEQLEKAGQLNPDYIELSLESGRAYAGKGDNDKAIAELKKFLEAAKKTPGLEAKTDYARKLIDEIQRR